MVADHTVDLAADVVLADGGVVRLRPIRRDDADRLVALHRRLSPQTRYLRFFSYHPELTSDEVEKFTNVDHHRREAIVAELRGELIAVGRYDVIDDDETAEVAFVVDDANQGRGIGTILLEHLAAAARGRGVTRFYAETLADNQRMLRVFREAGYKVTTRLDTGVFRVEFPVLPTSGSVAAIEAREHHAEAASIARMLRPQSIAVIGAGRTPGSIGHELFVNLIRHGFEGPVYPVNPTAVSVASVRAWPTVDKIPDDIDIAIIAVPPQAAAVVAEQCAAKGVCGLVVISGGFAEIGADGAALERELVQVARGAGMRIIGPNCIGVVNTDPAVRMNATFAAAAPARGRVGFMSQSGALGVAVLSAAAESGLGVSTFVSVGNKADVSGNDLLQYWEDDPDTDVCLLYLESFGNPRKFSRLARRVSATKPIVVVKSGRTEIGMRAASSHTAALASSDRAVDALFRQTGVIRVETLQAMLDVAQVLASQPLPRGDRIAILGNSGGPGILAADACAAAGLDVPPLAETTMARLREVVSPNAAVPNPIDMTAAAGGTEYAQALAAVLEDPAVDAVVIIFTPTVVAGSDEVAFALAPVIAESPKPVVVNFLATPVSPRAFRPVAGVGRAVPYFRSPEEAVAALGAVARYAAWKRRDPGTAIELGAEPRSVGRALSSVALVVEPEGRWLTQEEVDVLLGAYGIPTVRSVTVSSAADASAAASELGFPVALKAAGPSVIHKTDVGGVALGLTNAEAVETSYQRMQRFVGEAMTGAVVQPMAPDGVETIVGVVQDPAFGPLVMFGLGGVAAELLKDVAFRVVPLTDVDADELIRAPRTSPLLFGYRGSAAGDVAALRDLLMRVGRLADDQPDIAEVDLNPVRVLSQGVLVLDARIRLAPSMPVADVRRLR